MNTNLTANKSAVLLLTLMAACLSSGCATVGKSFNHENVQKLDLGQLKSAEYRSMFGEPRSVNKTSNTNGEYEAVRYIYAYADLGTATARVLDLEFRNGLLNAYVYVSGFSEDKTTVDRALVNEVKAGQAKEEVLRKLGKPSGKALSPCLLVDYKDKFKTGSEIWSWQTVNKLATLGSNPTEQTSVYVVFDAGGKVVETLTEENTTQRK